LLDVLERWLPAMGEPVSVGADPDMLPGREDAPPLIGMAFTCSSNHVAAVLIWQAHCQDVAEQMTEAGEADRLAA
jgi:hypothetical protein